MRAFRTLVAALAAFALTVSPVLAGTTARDHAASSYDAPSVSVSTPESGNIIDNGAQIRHNVVSLTIRPRDCAYNYCLRHIHSLNSRVDAGASLVANNISGTQAAVEKYVAVSADTGAVVKTDTTCPAEITTGGLGRTAGTFGGYSAPSTLNGTATYTITASFTASATYTINKLCMFNAASVGTMLFETLLGSPVTGNSGDVINVTWTVTV